MIKVPRRVIFSMLALGLLLATACSQSRSPAPSRSTTESAATESTLDQIKKQRTVLAGWAPYAPYASKSSSTGKVEGFYVDLFNRTAEEAKLEVVWVETTWSTMISDLGAGKFQVMAAPVFRTIPRSLEVAFTRPIDFFGYSAVVRVGDTRFKTIADFNKSGVKIAVTQGEVGHEFVKRHLPKAIAVEHKGGDIALALVDVIQNKADAAICDAWTAKQFVRQHAGEVEDLFGDRPFYNVGAGWFVKTGDQELLQFLNSSIDWLETSGTLEEIATRYELSSKPGTTPAARAR